MEGYTKSGRPAKGCDEDPKTRKARQARDRRARKRERKEAYRLLNSMRVLAIQEGIARAHRSKPTITKDGKFREYRIGANVAAMIRQLLHWEGKGEADGDWIYKSAFEWEQADAALTPAKLRTARRVAKEEGLWEEAKHERNDARTVVAYRLNMWRVAQVVVNSEIENTKVLLNRERGKTRRDTLKRKLKTLEIAGDDLGLVDESVTAHQTERTYVSSSEVSPGMPIDKGNPSISEDLDAHQSVQDAAHTPANLTSVSCENSSPTGEYSSRFPLSEYNSVEDRSVAGSDASDLSRDTTPGKDPFRRYCELLADEGLEVTDEDRRIIPLGLKRLAEDAGPGDLEAVVRHMVEKLLDSGEMMSPKQAWNELFPPTDNDIVIVGDDRSGSTSPAGPTL